jgi:hypothetical protein
VTGGAQTTCTQLDISPCDIHIFGPLKKDFKGRIFMSDDNVQEAMVQWFRQQPKEFFADGIH